LEIGTRHQMAAIQRSGRLPPEFGNTDRLNCSLIPVDAGEGLFDVQRSRLALSITAIPVEQAKRGVAGLLHLGHQYTAADRVNGAGFQEETVAGSGLEAVQTVGDSAIGQCVTQARLVNTITQAGVNPAAGTSVEDKPGLGLAALAG